MPVTPGQIGVTPGSGKILDTAELTVSSTLVEREVVTLGDGATAANYAGVTAAGALQVDGSAVTQPVDGALTNNNAAPAATLVGVLPAIAETAYTTATYTTGDMVLPVTDLHGATNTDLQAVAGTAVVTAASGVQKVGNVGNAGAIFDAAISSSTAAPANGLAVIGVFPSTDGGLLTNVQQALTTSASVKSSAGQLYGYAIFNPNTTTVYVFWYNTTSAPTIGSTTNLIYEIGIPAGASANVAIPHGIVHSTGIYVAVSNTATTSSAPSTGLVITTKYF